MCLLPSLTGSHSAVIAVVSFLILNKNSQTPLPSRAPSRLQSPRICKHNGYDSEPRAAPLIQWRSFCSCDQLVCVTVCARAHTHTNTHTLAGKGIHMHAKHLFHRQLLTALNLRALLHCGPLKHSGRARGPTGQRVSCDRCRTAIQSSRVVYAGIRRMTARNGSELPYNR